MSILDNIEKLKGRLSYLRGMQVQGIELPSQALVEFEPSQISVLVNTLLDATLPLDPRAKGVIEKHKGKHHNREGYPDYDAPAFDLRVELKGHFIEKMSPPLKEMRSRREASARLREASTEIDKDHDAILVVAWHLKEISGKVVPIIADYLVISAWDAAFVRDKSLLDRGGKFSSDGIPLRLKRGKAGSTPEDYELDDNFGKLKRIPHPELAAFLKKYS